MEEEFRFLLCERCQKEARNPKLLSCLHTLCTECLEENKPIGQCPVCRISIQHASGAFFQDNLLFANLQTRLNTYRKIASEADLVCDHCRDVATFWCSECLEFLCMKCHDAHQWYLKKSHESQKLSDLKNETAQSFLESGKKSSTLFCSEHAQPISIYCRVCHKPLCCSCALLDEHYSTRPYCDIRTEIENRKEELGRLKAELGEKKRSYENTYSTARERLQQLEKVRNETQDEIQEKVKEMIQWIQQKGEKLLEKADNQLRQEREDVERKLRGAERIGGRLESGERLVEKMNLFASDQEVLDMHPFIKESLDELRKEKLPVVGFRVQTENFAEVKGELQALLRRVKGQNDAVGRPANVNLHAAAAVNSNRCFCDNQRMCLAARPTVSFLSTQQSSCEEGEEEEEEEAAPVRTKTRPGGPLEEIQPKAQGTQVLTPTYTLSVAKTSQGFATSITSPVKRQVAQTEKSVQASPKVMKLEDHDYEAGETSTRHVQDIATGSHHLPIHQSSPEREKRGTVNSIELLENSPRENCETAVCSITISSSEDTEDDMM